MRFRLLVPFLLVESVNGAVVYLHQGLLADWQGWALLAAPLLLGLAAMALVPSAGPKEVAVEKGAKEAAEPASPAGPGPAPTPEEAPRPTPPGDAQEGAMGLLAVLQQEGRLVDFLMEDISPYDDAQVGAAAREVHDKCRKAVEEIFGLKPVLSAQEGSRVEVDEGFDPTRIRLVGRVGGGPPFKGVLLHPGWRCSRVSLPPDKGKGGIVAPAEVEI